MPLTLKDGEEVPLVRPKGEPPVFKYQTKKTEKEKKWKNGFFINELPSVKLLAKSRGFTEYKVPKMASVISVPVLVGITFRSYAENQSKNLSDSLADICIHYLDNKYPGWDVETGRPVSTSTAKRGSQKRLNNAYNLENYNLQQYTKWRRHSHFRGKKVTMSLRCPVSVYLTIRSIAQTQGRPLSDIYCEAMMFFFDEVIPGWELNGDYVPENP